MYKVLLVDDEYMITEGLKKLIPFDHWNMEVVATAEDADQALDYVREHPVDVVITDVNMPGKTGLQMIAEMKDLILLFVHHIEAIENKSFTLEADQVIFKRGRTAFVSSNTNFVTVNGNKGSVQVAFNIPVSGPNGLGGVTVDGNVSGYKVTTDKKGNIRLAMNITGVGISAQVNISLANGGNNATVDILPNFHSNRLTLSGTLLPLDKSSVFKGRSY